MKFTRTWLSTLLLLAIGTFSAFGSSPKISLDGAWRFQIDREDKGIQERWWSRGLTDKVGLPGDLTEQGIGDPVTTGTKWIGAIIDRSWFTEPEYAPYREPGNIKVPFWLQPEKYYAGAAWYQKEFEVPRAWGPDRTVLFLERPHWETRVWIDEAPIGTNTALGTPHEYDLRRLAPGKHKLTIRVDNRMVVDIGENSHSVSDHTQGNWNGIVGAIELRSTPLVWIEELRVYPDVEKRFFRVEGTIGSAAGVPGKGSVRLALFKKGSRRAIQQVTAGAQWDGTGSFSAQLNPGSELELWDEFNPRLYEITATLGRSEKTVQTGLRSISSHGTQFTLNGRTIFFRGTLECAIFPKKGHPPTDVDSWRQVLKAAKDHGLNMLRFHSWCPPEAAFIAADELGVYLHVEASSWANQSTTLGDGKPVDRWIYEETERILKYYGNHPSFVLMAYGNEPGGVAHKEYLAKWLEHVRRIDPRRLYTSGAGWPQLPENQWHSTPDPRVQRWGQGLKSRINAKPPETVTDYRDYISARSVPVVSHEIGQWCVYPNFDEIRKYTGYLKPRNFEIFQDKLHENGMADLARDFLHASGKLQALCYKEDIESALRTPGMGGFQLLDLHDFPGQGTALVGVLDPFWEPKGYITSREYRRFCDSVVPLARLEKRVFTADETLTAAIELAQYGPAPIDGEVEWKLVQLSPRKAVIEGGVLPKRTIPAGTNFPIGTLTAKLSGVKAPAQCKLILSVRGTDFANDWDFWVYPQTPPEIPNEVLVTAKFADEAQRYLKEGGKVLLTLPAKQVANYRKNPVKLGFSSIFWNTAWTGRQPPTTLGLLCDPKHPALALFPTETHSNWQWWYLVHRAGALRLDLLPEQAQPIVRIIDDWVTARPLGLIIEGRVGPGRIVICGFDLTTNTDDPVSRQLKASLSAYLQSSDSRATTALSPNEIRSLIGTPKVLAAGIISVAGSSEHEDHPTENAVDGNPETIWHTPWGEGAPACPHELTVELEAVQDIGGVTLLPRQDGNRNGWIKHYEVLASVKGRNWGAPVAQGELKNNASLKLVKFDKVTKAKFVRLRVLSTHSKAPYASLAEFKVQ